MISRRKEAFRHQVYHAKRRDIPFLFSFEEWVAWWEEKLGPDWMSKRGCRRGQYVMARFGDTGPYAPSNVKCILHGENIKEASTGRPVSAKTRAKISAANSGKQRTPEALKRMSDARLGKKRGPLSDETKQKISEALSGRSCPKTDVKMYSFGGKTLTAREWATELDITPSAFSLRLKQLDTPERVFRKRYERMCQ